MPTPRASWPLPNVDAPEEMVDMLGAARAYQANLTAINLIRDTVQRALELGTVSHGHHLHRIHCRRSAPRRPAAAASAATPAARRRRFGDSLRSCSSVGRVDGGRRPTARSAAWSTAPATCTTAMIALQRAEMSLQLTVQVRNKLVQAYQDIMRMPI